MKRYLFVLLVFLFFGVETKSLAQGQPVGDMAGNVLKTKKYTEINGSPYLTDSWATGTVKFKNGKVINNVLLKYDQVADELSFAGKNDEEYFFNDRVSEFTLTYIDDNMDHKKYFKSGFPTINNLSDKSFYEVLVDGAVSLLKKNAKDITQVKEFNSATTVKTVNNNIRYYIVKSNEITHLKKLDSKNLANSLDAGKANLIIDFIKRNDLNPKKDEDLKKIVLYYISIGEI